MQPIRVLSCGRTHPLPIIFIRCWADAGEIAAAHAAAKAQAADVEADRLTELVQLLRSRLAAAEQRCDEIGIH